MNADRLLPWAAGFLVVGATAVFDPWGWSSFGPLKWAIISTTSFVLAVIILSRTSFTVHRSSAMAWLFFLLWGAVVSLWALDPLSTWVGTPDRHLGLIAWLLFAVVFVAGQTMRGRFELVFLVRALVVAVTAAGIYVLLELAGWAPVDVASTAARSGGTFGSAAYLGAACALMLPAVVAGGVDGLGSALWKWCAWASVALGTAAAVAAQTRAAWVGLAVAMVVGLGPMWGWLRTRPWVPAAVVAAGLVIAVVTPTGARLVAVFDFDGGTTQGRIDEWQVGAAALSAHPVLGVGFEGYRIDFPSHVDADYERRYGRVVMPDRAHNGLLDVGITTGIAGVLLYLIAAAWLVVRGWKATRSGDVLLVGIGAGVIAYLVQQQFLFPIVEVDVVFWLMAGVIVGGRTVTWGIPRGLWAIPMVLAAATLTLGALDVAADHRSASALTAAAEGRTADAAAAAEGAITLRPDSFRYRFVAATVEAASGTARGFERAVAHLDAALRLSPGDPVINAAHAGYRLDLARLTRDGDTLRAATGELERLVAGDPYNAALRLDLGIAYALASQRQAAEEQWLRAADLAPGAVAPLANLVVAYLEEGRLGAAERLIAQIREQDPDADILEDLELRVTDAQKP